MAQLESRLETFFRTAVRRAGGISFKLAPTEAGVPDRLVLFPGGRMYLVELKTEAGRVSPIQRVWHNRAAELGCTVVVLAGWEAVALWAADPDSKWRSPTPVG